MSTINYSIEKSVGKVLVSVQRGMITVTEADPFGENPVRVRFPLADVDEIVDALLDLKSHDHVVARGVHELETKLGYGE